jgi:hypothetical protein
MALFQEAIVKKYIKQLDEENVDKAFLEFKTIYSESNIKIYKKIKEEAHQGEFIEDIFGKVLGYQRHVDIMREVKNETNAKKADAAILREDNVIGVIELKDNKTKNLSDVQQQAFNYKLNHKNCSYVITSNFHKLRFYIDDTTDYEEFDLYNLDKESFSRFYLYLQREGLLEKNLPKLLRQETKFHEEEISKSLYKDYSNFKRSFFENALKNNPQFDKLSLFKKSQKFLDRILFVLFAEDKGLVTTNSIVQIVEKWQDLRDDAFDTPRPLYTLVLLFFNNLYLGKKDNKGTVLIPEFGGELFAPDEVLDQLTIDDDVLKDDLLKLSKYDFNTDVDVNILGHIFEHSLNEVDDVEAELRGDSIDKSKSKRKKDGVFYTPKYITKYIVDNTLGKLCTEKKIELKLDEDIAIFDYQKTDGKLNEKGKDLFERLNSYKDWLLTVKVCDPACGSGAFLNQALSFFIEEHKFVDDIIAELTNSPLRLFDTDLQILESNIYGVDINEESVEIAKLSLWLRTAQPGRKLSILSDNIKCGNSLIDDPEVAGDKAFNWHQEFPSVFEKGGFDVMIGNPPYVRKQGLMEHYPEMCKFYEQRYISATANYDIYALFMERTFDFINEKGLVSYILPHKFLVTDFGEGIRKFFKEHKCVDSLIHFGSELIFADAATYTCIINLSKTKKDSLLFKKLSPKRLLDPFNWDYMSYENLSSSNWDLQSENEFDLIKKLNKQPYKVEDVFDNIFQGIATSLDEIYVFKGEDKGEFIEGYNDKKEHHFLIEKDIVKPFIKGNEVSRYKSPKIQHFVIFPYVSNNGKMEPIKESVLKETLPKTYEYLKHFEREIKGRERGRMNIDENWYLYIYPKSLDKFQKPKIMTQEISFGCNMIYDEQGYLFHPTTVYSFVKNEKFIVDEKFYLGILNSKVLWFFIKNTGTELGGGYFRFKTNYLKPFPLPAISEFSKPIIEKVNNQLEKTKEFQAVQNKFSNYFSAKFNLDKLSSKLEKWYDLTFQDFIKEINKAIKVSKGTPLSKKDEFEWMELFEENKKKALDLKSQIDQTNKEIDRMVYELYGLTEEEIQIVENS